MLYFQDKNTLTVYFSDGRMSSWKTSDPEFEKIMELIKKSDWVRVKALSNINRTILESKDIKLSDDSVEVKVDDDTSVQIPVSEKKHNLASLTKLLIEKGETKASLEKSKAFLKKCLENKYINAVEEIYLFCKAMDFEICDDGCFLAYKEVNKDMTSIHDGLTKHEIGKYTTVEQFCTDREVPCAEGLHFCSKNYLPQMKLSDSITIIVKVDPRDVVSIPLDHDFMKGRCCRYLPVAVSKNLKDGLKKEKSKKEDSGNKQKGTSIKSRKDEVYSLYISGKSTKEISDIVGVSQRTVQKYIHDKKKNN